VKIAVKNNDVLTAWRKLKRKMQKDNADSQRRLREIPKLSDRKKKGQGETGKEAKEKETAKTGSVLLRWKYDKLPYTGWSLCCRGRGHGFMGVDHPRHFGMRAAAHVAGLWLKDCQAILSEVSVKVAIGPMYSDSAITFCDCTPRGESYFFLVSEAFCLVTILRGFFLGKGERFFLFTVAFSSVTAFSPMTRVFLKRTLDEYFSTATSMDFALNNSGDGSTPVASSASILAFAALISGAILRSSATIVEITSFCLFFETFFVIKEMIDFKRSNAILM
jgi:ribosomal protein S21